MQSKAYEVVDRLNQTIILLGEGLNATEISKKLNISKDQHYKDVRSLKKRGLKYLASLGNQELSYLYNIWLSNRFHINKELWSMIKDSEITDSDKIRAFKTMIENDNSARETIKESINLFVVEELKNKLKALEDIQTKPDSKTSYFTELPELKQDSNTIIPLDSNNKDNTIDTDSSNTSV